METDGGSLFSEALTADAQAVLADDTTLISTDSTSATKCGFKVLMSQQTKHSHSETMPDSPLA